MKRRISFFILSASFAATIFAATTPEADEWFTKARAFLVGDGVSKDPAQAFALMQQAAQAGQPDAVGGLGYFYSNGVGGAPQDDALAAEWFRKGAALGNRKAMFNLGKMIIAGRAPKATPEEEGLDWIRKSADELPEAMNEMGKRYYHGDGLPQDYSEAFQWLRKAADAGIPEAQNSVGVMLASGLGTEKDATAAEEWYRKAANLGDAKAQSNLAHLIGLSDLDEERRAEALKWLILAAGQQEITAVKTFQALEATIPPEELANARKKAAAAQFQLKAASKQK